MNKGTHNLPSLALQSNENSSDLIFRGYLADTTPVLSAEILSCCCAGVIRSARGPCDLLVVFWASSLAKVGITVPKKEKLLAPMTIEVLTFALTVQAHRWPITLSHKTSKTKNCLIYTVYICVIGRQQQELYSLLYSVMLDRLISNGPCGLQWPTN